MDIIYEHTKQAHAFDSLIKLEETLEQTSEPSKSQFNDKPWEYYISKAVVDDKSITLEIYLRQWSTNTGGGQSGWDCDAKLKPQLIGIIDTFAGQINATNVEYESIDAKEEFIRVTMDIN
jgi:hypothetical protein